MRGDTRDDLAGRNLHLPPPPSPSPLLGEGRLGGGDGGFGAVVGVSFDLRLGDCLAADGMPSLADGSVDSVITDPPYEVEAHTLQRRTTRQAARVVTVEPLSFDPITQAQRDESARHMARIARRWILVFCQAEAVGAWRASLEAAGAVYKRACVWIKPDGMPQLTGDRPGMGYESIVAAHVPGKSEWNGGGRHGVFTFGKQPDGRLQEQAHPTQKPIALMETLVRLFTDPGETILDPFAGSATTLIAAIRNGRRAIGFEKDPRYYEIGRRRCEIAREQLTMFEKTA